MAEPTSNSSTLSKNVGVSLIRVAVNALVALVLPAYLTRHLSLETYGAWALILQLGALVSFLDIGIQTGIAKFVAEYDARSGEQEAGRHASAGLVMMTIAGGLGLVMTIWITWKVPLLFHEMPPTLYRDARISVLLVGTSLSFGLVCSVCSAIFIGLQLYTVPVAISIINRSLYTLVICTCVFLHGGLVTMGLAVALINIATGLLQVVAWQRKLAHIRLSYDNLKLETLKSMFSYCIVLALWSAAMLCISGLDLAIVGHYAFDQTAYYSLATLPANFLALIVSSALGPLMPAASALSTRRSPAGLGNILLRMTRYSNILVFVIGVSLLTGGFSILRLWAGPLYAASSIRYLQILILANMLRNLCLPYATMVVAIGRQKVATASAISEALVNLGSSIYLASTFGAIGVALGTLLGSLVSVLMHFGLSMHYTYPTISLKRTTLFVSGLLRPAIITIPSLLLIPFWWHFGNSLMNPFLWFSLGISTLAITWCASLNAEDRAAIQTSAYKITLLLQNREL